MEQMGPMTGRGSGMRAERPLTLHQATTSISGRDVQAIFCRRRHQPSRPPIWISSGRATRSTMPWRFRHKDRLQMPNTINATNPMPTNSTTSATESYSSQCRLPESMTFHPCFKWTARIDRQLPTRSLGGSSAVVATSRAGHRSRGSDREGQHRRLGQARRRTPLVQHSQKHHRWW